MVASLPVATIMFVSKSLSTFCNASIVITISLQLGHKNCAQRETVLATIPRNHNVKQTLHPTPIREQLIYQCAAIQHDVNVLHCWPRQIIQSETHDVITQLIKYFPWAHWGGVVYLCHRSQPSQVLKVTSHQVWICVCNSKDLQISWTGASPFMYDSNKFASMFGDFVTLSGIDSSNNGRDWPHSHTNP